MQFVGNLILGTILGMACLFGGLLLTTLAASFWENRPHGRTGHNAFGRPPRDPALTLGPLGQQHLQHTLTPATYRALHDTLERNSIWAAGRAAAAYWAALPTYLLARCPFCGAPYTGRLDTYSRAHWLLDGCTWGNVYGPATGLIWFSPYKGGDHIAGVRFQTVGCRHFLAVETFMYPPRQWPADVHIPRHIPYIIGTWLPDDIRSMAVFHSLPICRTEEDHFVPDAALYIVSYFAEDGETVWERRAKQERQSMARDQEYYPVLLRPRGPHSFDLRWWVAQGKLQWLDLESPDLPLRAGPPEAFPYVPLRD